MLVQLQRLDFARLAGIRSVLGLDLDGTSARIVAVQKRGNLLDKYKARYSAGAPLCCTFPPGATAETKGATIKEALASRRIQTRHCVATIRSLGVRTVTAQVPASVHDMGEWIGEHAAKLLKIPVALSELDLRWSVLESSPSGSLLEVTFVRKTDLEEVREIVKAAGLIMLHLGAGVGDVLNALFVSEPSIAEQDLTVAFVEGQKVTLVPLSRAKRKAMVTYPNGLDEPTRKSFEEKAGGELLWAGARSFAEILPQDKELKPYNLTPDYALATGLALKGFLPGLHLVDFLTEAECEEATVRLWQMGFKRTAIALGSLLFLLLTLHVAASMALTHLNEQAETEVSSSQDVLREVEGLREKVQALEAQVESSQTGASQGNLSRVLHELAGSVPASVRIDRLQAEAGQEQNELHLTLSLSVRSQEAVTTFMKQLEQAGFSAVTLIRLSASEGVGNPSSLLAAELEVTADPENLP
jgi:Tfp pilus assembly protein PilN